MQNTDKQQQSFLEFFPLTLFAGVSTLSSLSYTWGYFGPAYREVTTFAAIVLFILFSIIYLLKWIKYPELVKSDFNDPVAVNLFGVFFIPLLLISGLLRVYSPQLAFIVWIIGAALTFLFTYMVITRWISRQQNTLHALPAWMIPVMGLLDIPLTGLSYPGPTVHEFCVFCFAAGLLFTLIVAILVFQRLIFQEGLASTLQPTLLLLAAPFALSFSDYELITGTQGLVADVFFYISVFLLLLLGRKLIICLSKVQFTITWWATSFPLAAVTAASFRYASHSVLPASNIVLLILIMVSSLLFLVLCFQTVHYIVAHFLINACPKPSERLSLGELLKQH